MKVSVASLKKLVREAVEECYGEGMKEQSAVAGQGQRPAPGYGANVGSFSPSQRQSRTPAAPRPAADMTFTQDEVDAANRRMQTGVNEDAVASPAQSAPSGALSPSQRRGAVPAAPRPATQTADVSFTPAQAQRAAERAANLEEANLRKIIRHLVSETLAEQAGAGQDWRTRAASAGLATNRPRDVYYNRALAPNDEQERQQLIGLGYLTPEGAITPAGRAEFRNMVNRYAQQMIASGRPVAQGNVGRSGVEGWRAQAMNQAQQAATRALRGLRPETSAERQLRARAMTAPSAGGIAGALPGGKAQSDEEFNRMIGGLAAGAPTPGSAARTASRSPEEVERAGRERAATAMTTLAAQRRLDAERRRGAGAPAAVATPASLGLASAGNVPPLPRSGDAGLDAIATEPNGDPIEGLTEMVRKAVKKALSEKKNSAK